MNNDAGNRIVEAVIEIPKGSRNKYEYDHKLHRIKLDRVLYSSVYYPADYGFLEDTLSEDGDPLDVLVLTNEPTFPGCVVPARPIGILNMRDEKGIDHKILAVPVGDPRFNEVISLETLAPHWLKEIENFFATYKELENKWSEVTGWSGLEETWQRIDESIERYKKEEA